MWMWMRMRLRCVRVGVRAHPVCMQSLSWFSVEFTVCGLLPCQRDSKLTRLLQNSLGGDAKTSLIVTGSPSSSVRTASVAASVGFEQVCVPHTLSYPTLPLPLPCASTRDQPSSLLS
jgi:hypothetical protein